MLYRIHIYRAKMHKSDQFWWEQCLYMNTFVYVWMREKQIETTNGKKLDERQNGAESHSQYF